MDKIEQLMKHHTNGGRMIRHYNGEKEYILKEEDMNEIIELVKNCSIPDVVGQSEQLVCSCGRNHLDGEIKRNECAVCWLEVKAN